MRKNKGNEKMREQSRTGQLRTDENRTEQDRTEEVERRGCGRRTEGVRHNLKCKDNISSVKYSMLSLKK